MTDWVYQVHEARYEEGDLKLHVSVFSDETDAGRWYAILVDLSDPPAKIQRDQRAAMCLEELWPMAQEMLDAYVQSRNKTSKFLEWKRRE